MQILIAPDSFKDSLSATAAAAAIEKGLQRASARHQTRSFPLGDGGEGTADILTYHHSGHIISQEVSNPVGKPVNGHYGLSPDGRTAYIEMAAASGLQLLSPEERNPLQTSTYGTGELIVDALRRGARRILLCIGGSATNDGGAGMAAALGYRFLDEQGKALFPRGDNLEAIALIDKSGRIPTLDQVSFEVLCDVDNPLTGPRGAAEVYAPQKGAGAEAVLQLERGLQHLAFLWRQQGGGDLAAIPGAGAAGGLGFGALAFLGAQLFPGTDVVFRETGLRAALAESDLLITGEGRLDAQSGSGKLIAGLCREARQFHLPVIALCGSLEADPEAMETLGLQAAFSILPYPASLEQALRHSELWLTQTAFQVGRLLPGALRFPA